MPKLKTHRGAAKRFKSTAKGKFKRSKAFKNHMLHSVSLSRKEAKAVKTMLAGGENPLTGRTRREFDEKLGLEDEPS